MGNTQRLSEFEQKVQYIKDHYQISDDKWVGFFEDLGDLLVLVLNNTKPYLLEIDKELSQKLKEMGGVGKVTMNLNCRNYKVKNIHISYDKTVRVS